MKKSCSSWFAPFLLLVFQCPLLAQDQGKTFLKEQMTHDNSVTSQSRQGLAQIIASTYTHPAFFLALHKKIQTFIGKTGKDPNGISWRLENRI